MSPLLPLTLQDVMTSCPHTIGADQTLEYAKQVMYRLGVRHLPVLDGGQCVAVVSDRDIRIAFAVDPDSAGSAKVLDACSGEVFSLPPEAPVREAAQVMARDKIGSVVVMAGEKVVGIFTSTDACRVLSEQLS